MEIENLIIEYLSKGYTQAEIAQVLKEKQIQPNSLSSIEKVLKKLKEKHNAETLFHLACILYRKGILKK